MYKYAEMDPDAEITPGRKMSTNIPDADQTYDDEIAPTSKAGTSRATGITPKRYTAPERLSHIFFLKPFSSSRRPQ